MSHPGPQGWGVGSHPPASPTGGVGTWISAVFLALPYGHKKSRRADRCYTGYDEKNISHICEGQHETAG